MDVSDTVINIESLSKSYMVGHIKAPTERYIALRDVMARNAKSLLRKTKDMLQGKPIIQGDEVEEFWALKDVSFEVKQGDRVGIIGRNGAGKSTLLKILSRITEPTIGRITIKGRVASLLEVGTGFHPELTGRENIFLNGAILGMSRKEIQRKYNEIVEFAEVEKFLDTPVKRYSSGMYVRLAFAVAAHLEPEILVVDEVLAVGDAQFQKKCLGKMAEVSKEGRTVLFVSHNMQAIQNLCSTCVLFDQGRLQEIGLPEKVISHYIGADGFDSTTKWQDEFGIGDEDAALKSISVSSTAEGVLGQTFPTNADIVVEMEIHLSRPLSGLCVGFDLTDKNHSMVLRSYNTDPSTNDMPVLLPGRNRLQCIIPRGLLNAGTYQIAPRLSIHNQKWIVSSEPLIGFTTMLNHGQSPYWNGLNENSRPGSFAPIFNWINVTGDVP